MTLAWKPCPGWLGAGNAQQQLKHPEVRFGILVFIIAGTNRVLFYTLTLALYNCNAMLTSKCYSLFIPYHGLAACWCILLTDNQPDDHPSSSSSAATMISSLSRKLRHVSPSSNVPKCCTTPSSRQTRFSKYVGCHLWIWSRSNFLIEAQPIILWWRINSQAFSCGCSNDETTSKAPLKVAVILLILTI